MNKKPKNEGKKLEDELENLLSDFSHVENDEKIPQIADKLPSEKIDVMGVYSNAISKCKNLLLGMVDMYLSKKIISQNAYIRAKLDIEQAGLAEIINGINLNRRAIQIVMHQFELGDISPRLFDVLTSLQRTQIELVKMKTMYLTNMEENIKQLSDDHEIYSSTRHEIDKMDNTIDVESEEVSSEIKEHYHGTRALAKDLEKYSDVDSDDDIWSDVNEELI